MTSVKRCRTSFTCWHPLLPTFAARLIFAFRTLIGIACCATLTLSPVTSKAIHGQLLLSIGFIVAIKTTLGETIQTACRLYLAGGIAAIYCLFIVQLFPADIYIAVGATNIFVLLIVYTDLPVTVRRFSILPTCIILLQWFKKSHINTVYILHAWASLSIGCSLAVVVSCIPLPLIPTAYRELTKRMKFIAGQTRREIAATVLLISEYHNIHLQNSYNHEMDRHKSETDGRSEDEIILPTNSFREDDLYDHSTSFENLKDDHLLKSDIQDLHLLVNGEIKHMQRALEEISYEPYFIYLRANNLIRRVLRLIPYLKKFVDKPSTLEKRLEVWAVCFASLQRTITGMLSLDHHHHAFVGQRKLINAICLLLDSTFHFLESVLPYTISSERRINISNTVTCRAKVEEALEHFFETYAQVRENRFHSNMSNTDSILLNTFLLLVLRLVHVIITAAEASETPGVRLDSDLEQPTTDSPLLNKESHWKTYFRDLIDYIGLKPSFGKFIRAFKTSLSVLVSAVVVLKYRERLQAYGWVYWAPMTTALVSDSSEGGTIRLSVQRLMAVLLGSTYAYVIVLVAQEELAVGIFISIFVAFMGYIKTDPQKEYFASVCAQSASIITFISNQEGIKESNKAVLARTSLTFLGIFIHVIISNLFLPVSARGLIKKKVLMMINHVSSALKIATDDFCSFIEPNTANSNIADQSTSSSKKKPLYLTDTLSEIELITDDFPDLLEEALSEPNLWKRPFAEVKDRYDDISKTLRRIILNIRFVHRCTTILKAETKLHLAQEAKWQVRQPNLVPMNSNNSNADMRASHAWTMTELRKQKQLQDDLDIPLTIFMTYTPRSSARFERSSIISNNSLPSLRMTNTASYQPVLQHISALEQHIQQVLTYTRQLLEEQATVDVGAFELQQLCREDSFDERAKKPNENNNHHRRSSFKPIRQFQAIPLSTNHYKFFSCCHFSQQQDNQPLPSLRQAVDLMLAALIQFLYANNHFIRTELVSTQSIGDILAFHTLSYALKDMVEATTDLAKNARRIKHIDTRTLTYEERNEFFEYLTGYRSSCKYHCQGNVNIILSAPHGGNQMPDDVSDRTEGICNDQSEVRRYRTTVVKDSRTDEFAENVANALKSKWNFKPFVIIGKWHRIKVDFNRHIHEGTLNHSEAISAYHSYHSYLNNAIEQVNQLFGKGLLIDIHGHSKGNYAMIGYTLSSDQLNQDDLSDSSFQTSIESLCSTNRNECIRGENSFGNIFERNGLGIAYPSLLNPKPEERTYFAGGYIVRHYLSKINTIQTELAYSTRMGPDALENAQLFAQTIVEYMNKYNLLKSR
ncbi:unnamed protein product [Adineta ricciae]|uniref:Uncharacterized protein n=1 Tax=Adineta ricciae TaxID=249248 RepID=A0A813PZN9_ADIRI|nr:unnamed protein product [Adineta ricciae]CAF1085121.1 unnamed protein product [Adineta ricciae]